MSVMRDPRGDAEGKEEKETSTLVGPWWVTLVVYAVRRDGCGRWHPLQCGARLPQHRATVEGSTLGTFECFYFTRCLFF